MGEHTPGPWEWHYDVDNDDHWLCGADGDAVALELTSWKQSRSRANQSLIAAAPDLLAACNILCNTIKEFGQGQCNLNYDGPSLEFIEENWQDSTLPYLLVAYKAGEAAIAKAKTTA